MKMELFLREIIKYDVLLREIIKYDVMLDARNNSRPNNNIFIKKVVLNLLSKVLLDIDVLMCDLAIGLFYMNIGLK
jgi:hypothetical protein